MPFSSLTWPGVKNAVGNFLSSDAAPVVLGGAGKAVMAKYPTSWQYQLSQLGQALGQSNIAAKAAQRQAADRDAYKRLLAGLLSGRAITPPGTPGPTGASLTVNKDGEQELKVKGDKIIPSGIGSTSQPVSTPSPVPARVPVTNRTLPYYLAASGSSGTGNLFGLSPEQINKVAARDIAGERLAQGGIGLMYSNLQKQALSDYYDRLGYPKQQFKTTGMKIDSKTGNWSYFDQVAGKKVDTGIKATESELKGQRTGQKPTIIPVSGGMVDKNGIRRTAFYVARPDGTVETRLGGVFPEVSPASKSAAKLEQDVAATEARILGKTDSPPVPSDARFFNEHSDANYIYVYHPPVSIKYWPDKKEEFVKVKLPPGIKASDVYFTAKQHGITEKEVVDLLKKKKTK